MITVLSIRTFNSTSIKRVSTSFVIMKMQVPPQLSTPMSTLPDELIEELFPYFSLNEIIRWKRVDRRFNNLAIEYLQDQSPKQLDANNGTHLFLPHTEVDTRVARFASELDRRESPFDSCYSALGHRLSGYEEYKVRYTETVRNPIRSIDWLSQSYCGIEVIDLSSWSDVVNDRTIDHLCAAFAHHKTLRRLNISNCKRLTFRCSSSLSQLLLAGVKELVADNIAGPSVLLGEIPLTTSFTSTASPTTVVRKTNLVSVTSGTALAKAFGGWFDPANSSTETKLTVLSLKNNEWMDWSVAYRLLESCPHLESLDVSGCGGCTAEQPHFDLLRFCPKLTQVK